MSFTDNIRNIEKVRYDLRHYCESHIIPQYNTKYEDFDLEHLYGTIEYSLILAEDLYLNYDLCYTIAVYHEMTYNTKDENNFDTLVLVKSDEFIGNFFTSEELEIIASATKEFEGESREHRIFTSLYSKVIADADDISNMNAEFLIKKTWKKFFNKANTNIEVFNLLCDDLKETYGTFGDFKLLLKASYDLVKNEWNRTKIILGEKRDIVLIVLNLIKFSAIPRKDDKTLSKLVRLGEKEAVADSKPAMNPEELKDNDNDEFEFKDESLLDDSSLDIIFTEATTQSPKRKKAEALIYKVISTLDDTGVNLKKYKSFFGAMSDEQFDKYMKKFLKDEDENFYLEILPNKNEPSLKQIKQALDTLGVPSDEYVYLRHEGHVDDPIRTAYKVPVGYITIKRVQQTLSKKNTYSLDIAQRNMKTGQVTGHDKIARISDVESYSLVAIGADSALKEFLGPRADNSTAKTDMYKDISMYGYTYLKDMGQDITENQTLNTMYVYLMGAGLGNDLLKEDGTMEEIIQGKINRKINK
jgi:hypothetical protein